MPPIIFLFIFTLFVLVLSGWWLWRKLTNIPDVPMLQDLSDPIPKNATFEHIPHSRLENFYNSPLAKHSLSHELSILANKKIKAIYLVHGTFIGNDPFHIYQLIEDGVPETAKPLVVKFKEHCKRTGDFFAGDLGNFTEKHVQILKEMSKEKIPIHNFTWSSANHHYARLSGCLDLIEDLARQNFKSKDRILLLGHSHAGQIFALLTQILHNKNLQNYFFEILNSFDIEVQKYHPMIKKLKHNKFDIVTMGTPTRYSWNMVPNFRVLHIINHRGDNVLGGPLKGFITTKSGDYIQQWGVPGSDIVSPVKKEQEINKLLNNILGIGSSLELFKQNIHLRHRLHNYGHHYLMDYGDNSITPNFIKTGFGHWGYTKIELLSFHFELINQYFYA